MFLLAALAASFSLWVPAHAKDMPKPPSYEQRVAQYERDDERDPPPRNAVLFAGSSSVELWKLSKWFPDVKTINRGVSGSQYKDLSRFVDRVVVRYKPRTVVLYSGDNDVAAGRAPEEIAEEAGRVVARIRAQLPDTPIVVIAVKPSLKQLKRLDAIRRTGSLLEALVQHTSNARFVNVYPLMLDAKGLPRRELFRSDGLHMTDKGYAIWTALLEPMLK
ncbi:MAG: hypothetical protein HY075_04080 [Deltaproteobacteria bacterium]|nr:hypothetical protein [Deltaproteobacteria bacterium]